MILILIALLISFLFSILIIKSENKKDNELLKKRKDKIYEINNKINYKEYLNSPHWKETRLKALDRAGYRCQLCCNKTDLNVHHNNYKNLGHEDIKDLVVLCRYCHSKFHDKPY